MFEPVLIFIVDAAERVQHSSIMIRAMLEIAKKKLKCATLDAVRFGEARSSRSKPQNKERLNAVVWNLYICTIVSPCVCVQTEL